MTGSTSGYQAVPNPEMASCALLNVETEDEMLAFGYRGSRWRAVLLYVLAVFSLGMVFLLFRWRPAWQVYVSKVRCPMQLADAIILKDKSGHYHVVSVQICCIDRDSVVDPSTENYFSYSDMSSADDNADTAILLRDKNLSMRYFDFQHIRYIWVHDISSFNKIEDLSTNTKCAALHDNFKGLPEKVQFMKREIFGDNSIEVKVKSYGKLLIEEVLNPFYIFQIGSIILWMSDEYYYYASCIFLISGVSIGVSLYETKRQSVTLHNMVASTLTSVEVSRGNGDYETVPIKNLVPGDVLVIPAQGCIMSCDAVLIEGTCIVNESMLTGESVPVTKTPLSYQEDDEHYSPELHKRHTLFSGTNVVQTRYYGHAKVTAVVVRTGFSTAKGELVRAILFPKPVGLKFYKDAIKFILFLGVVAGIGMIYAIAQLIKLDTYPSKIVLRALDIITIVVPPALPAAMTVGTVYAQSRLKKQSVFCISPPRINFLGQLNLFCFDKTGTLTEDGLDLKGVLPVHASCFQSMVCDPTTMSVGPILNCMATCHSLTVIDGELHGDPLDLKMFLSTKWVLEEPGRDTTKFDTIMPTIVRPCTIDAFQPVAADQSLYEVGIVRQFTFSSTMQRMSVITRTLDKDHMELYCKGAPEKITSLCKPSSVPVDFHDILRSYTILGYRVIALASRQLDHRLSWHQAQRISRDKVETGLDFLGLLVMQNTLKVETTPIITVLREANIRTVMVTGDMLLTAVSVARDCGMILPEEQVIVVNATPPDSEKPATVEWEYAEQPTESESRQTYSAIQVADDARPSYRFAITGKSFAVLSTHFPNILSRLFVRGSVFARMAPDQKAQLIENLQTLGYGVGMCGDGANDCEALKQAHAGISLSEAEASVAAPFTSKTNNIQCVVTAMREGRAALVTSFGCFKYMALYSLIQFISVTILYTFGANLADFQYLYIDLVITTTIAILKNGDAFMIGTDTIKPGIIIMHCAWIHYPVGHTGTYDKLMKEHPPGSLVTVKNLLSIVAQIAIAVSFQVGAFVFLQEQKWYVRAVPDHKADQVLSFESTIIFLVSSYQYMTVAICFSKGPPFRKPIYTNIPFTLALLILFGFTTLLLLHPFEVIRKFMQLRRIPSKAFMFRVLLLIIVASNFLICIFMETIITETKLVKRIFSFIKRKRNPTKRYKQIDKELKQLPDWPPVGHVTHTDKVQDIHVGMNLQEST